MQLYGLSKNFEIHMHYDEMLCVPFNDPTIKVKVTIQGQMLHLGLSGRYHLNQLTDCCQTWSKYAL